LPERATDQAGDCDWFEVDFKFHLGCALELVIIAASMTPNQTLAQAGYESNRQCEPENATIAVGGTAVRYSATGQGQGAHKLLADASHHWPADRRLSCKRLI